MNQWTTRAPRPPGRPVLPIRICAQGPDATSAAGSARRLCGCGPCITGGGGPLRRSGRAPKWLLGAGGDHD
jgi:hypothetical protein